MCRDVKREDLERIRIDLERSIQKGFRWQYTFEGIPGGLQSSIRTSAELTDKELLKEIKKTERTYKCKGLKATKKNLVAMLAAMNPVA